MIYFAGTNLDKAREYQRVISSGVEFTHFVCQEIQSDEVTEIARKKAFDAYQSIKKPLFVDDTGLYIDSLGGLPGPFVTWFIGSIGSAGIADLCKGVRSATLKTAISYIDDSGSDHTFYGEMLGSIAIQPRGGNGFGFDDIFIPNGHDLTLAEMTNEQKDQYNPRIFAASKLERLINQQKA